MTQRLIMTGLFLLCACVAPVLTHGGHDHKVMGAISMVHENHLDVKTTDGKTVVIALNDKTVYLKGKTKMSAVDLKVADRVVVNVGDGKEPLTAKEIVLTAKPARGGR